MNLPKCNSCGGELRRENSNFSFEVNFACSECRQSISVRAPHTDVDGYHPYGIAMTILPRLYPQHPSVAMQHEIIDYRTNERIFASSLAVAAGYRTEAEHEKSHLLFLQQREDAHWELMSDIPATWWAKLIRRFARK